MSPYHLRGKELDVSVSYLLVSLWPCLYTRGYSGLPATINLDVGLVLVSGVT